MNQNCVEAVARVPFSVLQSQTFALICVCLRVRVPILSPLDEQRAWIVTLDLATMRVAISSSSTSRTCAPARQRPADAVAAAAATPNGARAADAPSSAAQRLAALAAAALVLAAPSAALAVDFTGMTGEMRALQAPWELWS